MAKPPLTVEDLGAVLFGRGLRLKVARWVRSSPYPDFFAALIAEDLHVPSSNVAQELDRFLALGMVRSLPAVRGDRAKRFVLEPGPLWAVIDAALAAVDASFVEAVSSLNSK